MKREIVWESLIGAALARAKAENKHVLLEFFDPSRSDRTQMDKVTYSDSMVADFIERHMIPLRVSCHAQPLSRDFAIRQTPTIIILDTVGMEHQRTVGFISPDALIPSLLLGIAKSHLGRGEYGDALSTLDALLIEYPKSDWAPEAVYLRGVCWYKTTQDAGLLKKAYEQLSADYPSSQWAKKTYPYRYRL